MQWIFAQGDRAFALANTDFCPWANKYVYWLKQPVGWFAIAALLSFLVGAFVSPNGWILMCVILVIMAVGMAWPWLAVRAVEGALEPSLECVHEGEHLDLVVRMRNRWPMPQFGISVDGFLDRPADDQHPMPSVALSCVPALSEASYRLAVSPQMRGHYPLQAPTVACAFPFGIWTARRELKRVKPLTVWPKVYSILDEVDLGGNQAAEAGEGIRSGQAGEPLGVRAFRQGDRLKNVHWIHTARTGQIVVCERGGPQRQEIELILDPCCLPSLASDRSNRAKYEQSLAQRVRLLASIAVQLHARHTHLILTIIGGEQQRISCSLQGRRRLLDLLASVPVAGISENQPKAESTNGRLQLMVKAGTRLEHAEVRLFDGRKSLNRESQCVEFSVFDRDFANRLERFWRELRGATRAA